MSKYDAPSCAVHVSLVKRPWWKRISGSFLTRRYWLVWSRTLSLAIISRSLDGATSKQAWYADTVIYRLFEQAINTPTKHDLQGVMNPYHQQDSNPACLDSILRCQCLLTLLLPWTLTKVMQYFAHDVHVHVGLHIVRLCVSVWAIDHAVLVMGLFPIF